MRIRERIVWRNPQKNRVSLRGILPSFIRTRFSKITDSSTFLLRLFCVAQQTTLRNRLYLCKSLKRKALRIKRAMEFILTPQNFLTMENCQTWMIFKKELGLRRIRKKRICAILHFGNLRIQMEDPLTPLRMTTLRVVKWSGRARGG